ncbi:hypothetical protein [Thermomonas flagellata]|uniref:hypothetical protein n=1 Tax=Thermomonas flagellata TaxID=2888524 RepID=UPI001F0355A1|nr:hypothetical protein [Thermomonas flagellata]
MDYLALNSFWRCAVVFLLAAAVVGCSSTTVRCGGRVYPEKASADALSVVKKTEVDSKEFCAESGGGCDFTVAKTKQGWSVAATRTFAVDGKCASRIGDEKIYIYDESGVLVRAIDGM